MKRATRGKWHGVTVLLVLLGGAILAAGAGADGPQMPSAVTAPGKRVVLLHDDRAVAHRLPPPPQVELSAQAATFTVNWNPPGCWGTTAPWPQEAKEALNFAVSIWSSLLESSEAIIVDACWRTDLHPQHIAEGGPTSWHEGFAAAPVGATWYAGSLANALSHGDINDHDGWDLDNDGSDVDSEMGIEFNSTYTWYLGTDGNTPPGQLDFVSTVLHEMTHGLGFNGFAAVDTGDNACATSSAGDGCIGWQSYPAIYDRFSEDGQGGPLLEYPIPSAALGNALVGGQGGVYFSGPAAKQANGNGPVKLYAPQQWGASSYSHLDEVFNLTPNSLMTHRQANGTAEHHPGPITLGILQDIGWSITTIETPAVYMPLISRAEHLPGSWVTIMREEFETGFPSSAWLVVDENQAGDAAFWGRRDCRSSEGSFAAWSVGAGDTPPSCGSEAPGGTSAWMVYGPFSLADAAAAELTFDWWSDTEFEQDVFAWGASVDDNHYHGSQVTGDHRNWTIGERLDLGAVPVLGSLLGEEQVWIAFSFDSAVPAPHEGSWVDNILLRKQLAPAATSSGARADMGNEPQRVLQPNQTFRTASRLRHRTDTWTTPGGLR